MDAWTGIVFWAVVYGAGVYAVTRGVRALIENLAPGVRRAFWWKKSLLLLLPLLLGGAFAALLFGLYPFPPQLTTRAATAVWGVFLGSQSTLLYQLGRNRIKELAARRQGTTTVAPPGATSVLPPSQESVIQPPTVPPAATPDAPALPSVVVTDVKIWAVDADSKADTVARPGETEEG